MKKKPIAGKRPQPKAPRSDDDAGQDAPATASAPAAEDELALQAAPETHFPGEQLKTMRRRTPPDAKGTALDIQDTSRLLIAVWIVIGAVVIGSVYWLMVRSDKDAETARNTDTSAPAAQLPQAATNAAKAKAAEDDAKYKSNSSNSAAFANYLKFGQWALANATDWGGEKLVDKMTQEVSLASVDDPDVKELLELQKENWKLMPDHPLRPYEAQGSALGEVTGQKSNSAALNTYKLNDDKIKGLTFKLRKRYGVNL